MWLIISLIIQVQLMKDVIDTVWFKDAFKIIYLTSGSRHYPEAKNKI